MRRFVGQFLILLCTLIWGTAFLAQKSVCGCLGPFAVTSVRNILAGFFLAGWVAALGRRVRPERVELVGGAWSGVVLFAAMVTQQLGIETVTPGVSAFLTANYILFVPLVAWAFGRGRPRLWAVFCAAVALAGTFLICLSGADLAEFRFGRGEAWTLLCAALFAVQILVVDHYAARHAGRCDVLRFSMVQVVTAGLCSAPFMLLGSELAFLTAANLKAGVLPVLYLGILSSGIAYTLQNLGQARTAPAVASIIMSFESVVGAVSGYLYFGDVLSSAQIAGCGLVFAAILLSQRQGR